MGADWLHGHYNAYRGAVYYNDGWKFYGYTTNPDNWVCTIGKNVGATPGNILIDGVASGTATGGAGSVRLGINYGSNSGEKPMTGLVDAEDVGFLLGTAVQALVGTVDLIGTDVGDTTGADELEQGTFA